jgi:hypothetical protein
MSLDEIKAKLAEWQSLQKPFAAAYEAFEKLTGADPDCELLSPMFALWEAYTAATAELIGDAGEWLEWYEYQCHMGERPSAVTFPDGREMTIETLDDLAELIMDETEKA